LLLLFGGVLYAKLYHDSDILHKQCVGHAMDTKRLKGVFDSIN
jgi:hypothetical protein